MKIGFNTFTVSLSNGQNSYNLPDKKVGMDRPILALFTRAGNESTPQTINKQKLINAASLDAMHITLKDGSKAVISNTPMRMILDRSTNGFQKGFEVGGVAINWADSTLECQDPSFI